MPGGPCRRNQRKQMKQMEMRRLHGSPGLCTFFQLPAVAGRRELLMSKQNHLADAKMAFHSAHSVNQQTFIEQLLCARAQAQGWKHSHKQNIKIPASWHLGPRGKVNGYRWDMAGT